MNLESIIWLVLPLLGIVILATVRPRKEQSRKGLLAGIIVSAAIVGGYIILRWLFLGGF